MILKDRRSRFGFGAKSSIGTFSFQGGEEALHGRIVITIAGAAHADLALSCLQQAPVSLTGILAAAIRVVQQLSGWMAIDDRHAPGTFHQLGIQPIPHGPAHHPPGIQIQDDGQIQPAFCGFDVGDVTNPFFVGSGSLKVLVEQVGRRSGTRLAAGWSVDANGQLLPAPAELFSSSAPHDDVNRPAQRAKSASECAHCHRCCG